MVGFKKILNWYNNVDAYVPGSIQTRLTYGITGQKKDTKGVCHADSTLKLKI